MTERIARLSLRIDAGPEAEAEELAQRAVELRRELLELDIEFAEPAAAGPAPPGTRGDEFLIAGALIVTLVRSPGLVKALIETVQLWITRDQHRTVELEINGDELKLTGITGEDQHEVIQDWIKRNTEPEIE